MNQNLTINFDSGEKIIEDAEISFSNNGEKSEIKIIYNLNDNIDVKNIDLIKNFIVNINMKVFFQGFKNKCPKLSPFLPNDPIKVQNKVIYRKSLDHLFLSTEYIYELCFVIRCLQNMTSEYKINTFFEWSVLTDDDVHPDNNLFKKVYLNDSDRMLFESNRLYHYIKNIVWLQPSDIELIRRIYESIFYSSKANDPNVIQFIKDEAFNIDVKYNDIISDYNKYVNEFKFLSITLKQKLIELGMPKYIGFDGGSFVYLNKQYKNIALLLKINEIQTNEFGEYTTDFDITHKNNLPKYINYKFISPDMQYFIYNTVNTDEYNLIISEYIKNKNVLQLKYKNILNKLINIISTSTLSNGCILKMFNTDLDEFITFNNSSVTYNARGHFIYKDELLSTDLKSFLHESVNTNLIDKKSETFGKEYVKVKKLMTLSKEYVKKLIYSRLILFNTVAPMNESLQLTFDNICLEEKTGIDYLTSLTQYQINKSHEVIFANNIFKYLNKIKMNLGKLQKFPTDKYNQISKYFTKDDTYSLRLSNNHPDNLKHTLERDFLVFEIIKNGKIIIMDTEYYSLLNEHVSYKDVKLNKKRNDEMIEFIKNNKSKFKTKILK